MEDKQNNMLEGLNKEQLEAVTHQQGPLLIIAGAGTGKTAVITRRIAWLIASGRAKPDQILALTFTDKAAREMLERVDILVPYGYTDIWVSTFHAFGDKILRENALIAGLNPDFKVLTQPEAAVLFREHLFEFELSYYRPLSDPTRFIEAFISLFSRARDEDISPEEYLAYAQNLIFQAKSDAGDPAKEEQARRHMEIARAYAKYTELLLKQGLVDFANQFYLALQLLRKHPLILKGYQEKFRYILVDEFQDTNFAQYQLIKLLAGSNKNIAVTGDDDQCIYRFRGAAYSNLLNFINDFPGTKKISIIQNYRSHQALLDSAYRLIQHNNPERFEVKAGINKRLIGKKTKGSAPQHLEFDTNSTEADFIAAKIKKDAASGNFKYNDFAILVRSNSDAQAYLQALNMQNIPWRFSGTVGLYSREEVKVCINFLRVMANLADSLSLYYLVSCEIYALELADLTLCMHYAKRRNRPLYFVFKELDNIAELSETGKGFRDKVNNFLADFSKFLEISRQASAGRLLYTFLTDTGYLKKLTRSPSLENEAKIENMAKFFNIVRDFELVAREARVTNFVNYLDLLIEAGDDPETVEADLDSDAVNVLTIHKAKGLEFRVVFMVSLVNGRFPWPHRSQPIELPDALIKEILPLGDFHIQEERRLFFVGMTRAKEELYLTCASDYGGRRMRTTSQFIIEALGSVGEEKTKQKTSPMEVIGRFAPKTESRKAAVPQIAEEELLRLSYYHIDDYLTCPLKYKYVHILHVPIMEHHTVIYGRAMHEAVTKYFQFKLAGRKMEPGGLLAIFRENFIPQGFLDERHQEERYRIGCAALERFYEAEQKNDSQPFFIEKDFSFVLGNDKIVGRFDRVDIEDDQAIIIDFKTSQITKQKEADRRTKESLQLILYAFAYKNIFGVLPKCVKLHFLESGLVGTAHIDDDDLTELKGKIEQVSAGIRKREFKARPTYNACLYCAYNQVCPSASVK